MGPSPVDLYFLIVFYDCIGMNMNIIGAGFTTSHSSPLCSVFLLIFREVKTFFSVLNDMLRHPGPSLEGELAVGEASGAWEAGGAGLSEAQGLLTWGRTGRREASAEC